MYMLFALSFKGKFTKFIKIRHGRGAPFSRIQQTSKIWGATIFQDKRLPFSRKRRSRPLLLMMLEHTVITITNTLKKVDASTAVGFPRL